MSNISNIRITSCIQDLESALHNFSNISTLTADSHTLTKHLDQKIDQSPGFLLNLLEPNVIEINFGPLQELLAQTLTGRTSDSRGTAASPS